MDTLSTQYYRVRGDDDSWRVDAADLWLDRRRVEVGRARGRSGVYCPESGHSLGLAYHAGERRRRHLGKKHVTTELVPGLPRCRSQDGRAKTIVPLRAGKHSRFTLFHEALSIDGLRACCTVKAAAPALGFSCDAAHTIMNRVTKRAFQRRHAPPILHARIDEKSLRRGRDCVALLADIDGLRVPNVAAERTDTVVEAVLQTLPVQQRQGVAAVAAYMLAAYASALAIHTLNAELVHDKSHNPKHLGKAVDPVRRPDNEAINAEDDDRINGTRQLWLSSNANPSPTQRRSCATIQRNGPTTARAWTMKEVFRRLPRRVHPMSAEVFYSQWYIWALRCRFRSFGNAATILLRHLTSPLSYFRLRIINAAKADFNSVLEALKHAACGFRCFENYRRPILFFCGQQDLMPRLT